MFAKPIARTLAALGFHAQTQTDAGTGLLTGFADSDGEIPTPVEPPQPRIPPHQRHLHMRPNELLRGYSMGSYRPAATLVGDAAPAAKPSKRAVKSHKRGRASPKHA